MALVVAVLTAGAAAITTSTWATSSAPSDGADVAEHVPSDVTTTTEEVEVDAAGVVVKDLGDAGGLTDAAGRRSYFTVAVAAVHVTTSCPGRTSTLVLPGRTYFVAIDVDAAMAADVPAAAGVGGDVFMPLTADAFRVVDDAGTVRGGPGAAAWACFSDVSLAAPFVGRGEATRGLVVLESDVASGWVEYQPTPGTAWRWPFGG